MDKKKASPRRPPIEDLQGHSYQHELGDPDRAEQIENRISKVRRSSVRPEREAFQTGEKPVVVVTGSAGLIGAKVVEAFASDYQVVGLDLKAPKKGPASAGFVECDLTEDKSVQDAFAKIRRIYGQRLASIIHLAAYYDFSGEPSEMYEQLTVNGTLRLFRELKQFDVEQFVFSSTILVMEPAHEDEILTESSPLEHEPWDYPRSKIKTERLIRLERGEIPAVILRIAGVYDETGHAVPIAQQISRIYQKQFESHFFPAMRATARHSSIWTTLSIASDASSNVARR